MKFTTAYNVIGTAMMALSLSSNAFASKEAKMNYPINVVAQNYTDSDGVLLQGFLSTPNSTSAVVDDNANEVLPAVVILHDSSGPDDYEKQRATMIANELGYVAFAADIFGVETDIPVDTGGWGGEYAQFIGSFTGNAALFTKRIAAAVDYVQSLPNVDETKVAILGYCLGGTGVVHYINVAGEKEGGAAAAVGIHPSLLGSWGKPLGEINIPSLFLTGGNDFLTGPQAMTSLEDDMKSASTVEWETNRYSQIGHAFSNWYSENYNARADERSWNSLKTFLVDKFERQSDESSYSWESASLIDLDKYERIPAENCSPCITTEEILDPLLGTYDYIVSADNVRNVCSESPWKLCKGPTVVILPDKSESGIQFARQRAVEIVKRYGYVAWVAEGEVPKRDLFPSVGYIDSEKVALEGYGSGAQDALNLAMEVSSSADKEDVYKVISIFQVPGNITAVTTDEASTYKPQILIASGVDGADMSTIVALESMLMGMDANYELNRYSGASANFPDWNDPSYNPYAAERSFEAIESIYREMFGEFPFESQTPTTTPAPMPSTLSQTFAPSGARDVKVTTFSSFVLLAVVYNNILTMI